MFDFWNKQNERYNRGIVVEVVYNNWYDRVGIVNNVG